MVIKHMNPHRAAYTESIISHKPVIYSVNGQINVAVHGILMPYRIFMMSLMACLHGSSTVILNTEISTNSGLANTMVKLQEGMQIPSRFKDVYGTTPWKAAHLATMEIFSELRNFREKNIKIIEVLRDIHEQYESLYEAPVAQSAEIFLFIEEVKRHPSLGGAVEARKYFDPLGQPVVLSR